jgi:hypothetical protein
MSDFFEHKVAKSGSHARILVASATARYLGQPRAGTFSFVRMCKVTSATSNSTK